MWDLVPWPVMVPRALATGPPGKSLNASSSECLFVCFVVIIRNSVIGMLVELKEENMYNVTM